LRELINEHSKFSDYVEKLDTKCDGGGAEKFDDGVTGQSANPTP